MSKQIIRCANYTRKPTDEGLDQEFNSLDAQHEACTAYITSQRYEGWKALPARFDDGGISGGTLDRPSMQRLVVGGDGIYLSAKRRSTTPIELWLYLIYQGIDGIPGLAFKPWKRVKLDCIVNRFKNR